jgi:hypothetical protein
MSPRFIRFAAFVSLFVAFACGSSKDTHVDNPQPTASASASVAAPVASETASASASQAPPTPINPPAQIAWHPLLYKIAGTKPSYLFGTIHVPDSRIANFPPALDQAIASSDEIVNEMPLDNASNPMAMMASFQMPNGQTLTSQLSPALHARLAQVFQSKGLPLMPFEHFKVWAVAAQVALIDHLMEMMSGGKAIDMNIHDKGKAAGKKTSGLETEAEQLQVFDGLTKDEQSRVLEQTLDQRDKDLKDGKDPVAKLMSLYIAGDEVPLLAELNAGFDPQKPLDQKLLKRLITDRNKIMTDRIAAKLKGPARSYFIAVGAAHLLGDDGVVAQLKKKGVTIERVP